MRDTKGFTLIELLIVVVIIGILAAIAIPKFSATREKAYYSAMKSDLKNLATQQEIYYADNDFTYADDEDNDDLGWTRSDGVAVDNLNADQTGWAAAVSHDALSSEGCAVYHGDIEAVPTPGGLNLDQPGSVVCDDGTGEGVTP